MKTLPRKEILSRAERGKIIEAFDKAQRKFDEVHGALLTACKGHQRSDLLNELLVELDRGAQAVDKHRREVGRLLDELRGEAG